MEWRYKRLTFEAFRPRHEKAYVNQGDELRMLDDDEFKLALGNDGDATATDSSARKRHSNGRRRGEAGGSKRWHDDGSKMV